MLVESRKLLETLKSNTLHTEHPHSNTNANSNSMEYSKDINGRLNKSPLKSPTIAATSLLSNSINTEEDDEYTFGKTKGMRNSIVNTMRSVCYII